MRILLVGASGMIGTSLARKLSAAGHELIIGARDVTKARRLWPSASVVHVDFADPASNRSWTQTLRGVDAVVNAVGIFDERGGQSFDAIHVNGPMGLFEAAAALAIRVVQISALGANPESRFAYMASKGRAESELRRLAGPHTIVRPSLVFAPDSASTRWFATLAALPLTPLPGSGVQPIQPIHIEDLCDAVVRLIESEKPPMQLEAVGPEPVTFREYLETFKRALHLPGVFLGIPMSGARALSRLAARFVPLAAPEALAMLEAGNTGNARELTTLLGRAPRPTQAFFDESARNALRRHAQLAWLVPLLRLSVAITWIVTGIVSAFVYPTSSSLALLSRTGLDGNAALLALYGAAALDIALGVTTLTRRFRKWSYRAQMVLIAFYTVVITLCLPEFWAHPYGPILKNLPLVAAIAALHELDDAHGSDRR